MRNAILLVMILFSSANASTLRVLSGTVSAGGFNDPFFSASQGGAESTGDVRLEEQFVRNGAIVEAKAIIEETLSQSGHYIPKARLLARSDTTQGLAGTYWLSVSATTRITESLVLRPNHEHPLWHNGSLLVGAVVTQVQDKGSLAYNGASYGIAQYDRSLGIQALFPAVTVPMIGSSSFVRYGGLGGSDDVNDSDFFVTTYTRPFTVNFNDPATLPVLYWTLQQSVYTSFITNGCTAACFTVVEADFSKTTSLEGFRILDPAGQDISAAFYLTNSTGEYYYGGAFPQSEVPEPSTWSMLSFAAAVLICRKRASNLARSSALNRFRRV